MTNGVDMVFILMVVFQLKHFAADYLFQHNYMLKKVSPEWDFVGPLALHCAVHGIMTLLICLYFNPSLWWLGLVDFSIHFFLDRLRSGPNYLGRFKNINTSSFWWVLGADQMMHHLTHIGIIWYIVKSVPY